MNWNNDQFVIRDLRDDDYDASIYLVRWVECWSSLEKSRYRNGT